MTARTSPTWRPDRRLGPAFVGVALLLLAHQALMTTERPAEPAALALPGIAAHPTTGERMAPNAGPGVASPWRHGPHTILDECPASHALLPFFLCCFLLAPLAIVRAGAGASRDTLDARGPGSGPRSLPLLPFLPLPTPVQRRALLHVFLN